MAWICVIIALAWIYISWALATADEPPDQDAE